MDTAVLRLLAAIPCRSATDQMKAASLRVVGLLARHSVLLTWPFLLPTYLVHVGVRPPRMIVTDASAERVPTNQRASGGQPALSWGRRTISPRGSGVQGARRPCGLTMACLGVVLHQDLGTVALALGDHAHVEAGVEQLSGCELPKGEDRAVER